MLNQVSKSGQVTIPQDSAVTVGCDANAVEHQITIKRGTATAGTVTVTATPIDAGSAETVYSNGAALVHNLATTSQMTYPALRGYLDSITFTVAGSNGTTIITKGDA